MNIFLNSKFRTICKETKLPILVGDVVLWIPGKGSYCESSKAFHYAKAKELQLHRQREPHFTDK